MAGEVETNCAQKLFGHCLINWTVHTFSLQTCKEYWIIETPVFNVRGPSITKWKLVLSAQSEDKYISLYLSRVEFDEGPDVVRVDWKVRLLDSDGHDYTLKTLRNTFGKNSTFNVELPGIDTILRTITPFKSVDLNISCQMLVVSGSPTHFPRPTNENLASLLHDLAELQTTNTYDAVIEIDDNVIGVHKAIISCRNDELANLLKGKIKVILNYPGIVYPAMKEIINFLYTGNVDIILGNPSLSIYECISKFNIAEMNHYYLTDQIKISSTVEAEVTAFEWVLRNFSKVKGDILLGPPNLTNGVPNINWRLRLDRTGDGQHIAIYVEIVEVDGMKPLDICLEFGITDFNRKPFFTSRLQKRLEKIEYLGFDKFLSKNELEKYLSLAGDTLRVAVKFQISKDIQSSSIDGYVASFMPSLFDMHSYRTLMVNIRSLFKESLKNEDIILMAGEDAIAAHKCMLSARSRAFAIMINNMKEGQEELHLTDVNRVALQVMLNFIYCHGIGILSVKELLVCYQTAKIFVIPVLQQICFSQIKDSFLVDDIYDILDSAHRTDDRELIDMVLQTISGNARQFQDINWERLAAINEALRNNVKRVYEAGLSLNQ